jgi:hypothetical protein
MEQNSNPLQVASPRRFVYRAAQPDPGHEHPMRRRTDAFRTIPDPHSPRPLLLEMRAYFKLK